MPAAVSVHVPAAGSKISADVTKGVKVTDADVKKYYDTNKANYTQAASRDVRHILVNSKKLADSIESQLKAGGNFAKLAKKYSKDTGSAVNGGKLTVQKGKTVPEFDKAAFSLKTNEISAPVHTTYGWHIIQALSAIKPAQTKSLKDEQATIRQQLVSTKKQDAMTKWLDDMKKSYSKKVRYQAGYTPTATTSPSAPSGDSTAPSVRDSPFSPDPMTFRRTQASARRLSVRRSTEQGHRLGEGKQ